MKRKLIFLVLLAVAFWIVIVAVPAVVSPSENMIEYNSALVSGSGRAQVPENKASPQVNEVARAISGNQAVMTPVPAVANSGVEQAAETTIKKKAMSATPALNGLGFVWSYS